MRKTGEERVSARRRGRRALGIGAALALVAGALIAVAPTAAVADGGSSCGPTINPIVCENSKPGTDPDVWDIDGAGDPSIQGFATDISVNAGSRIDFKVDTDATSYTIDIYRTGWYQGLGARFIQSVPVTARLPQHQPECISDATTELYDCGTWGVSASWNVPSTAVSGVYIDFLNRLVLADGAPVDLTPKEFDIVAVLARYPGVVVPRDRIIREVWGTDWSGFSRSLEVHVGSIRRKLDRPSLIATVRGVGYRLTGS